ncbi:MAG: hypothetical protein DLM70_18825 [Chloroflexi bacterium]|nr:MAG: hypothetical protein DLM70_18825 [Chloroflexota bacterium]
MEVERQHTAASLFNLLRWKLTSDLDIVDCPSSRDDLSALEPGGLVEVRGTIASDPVLDLFEALRDVIASVRHLSNVSAIESLMDQGLETLLQSLGTQPGMEFLQKALRAETKSGPQQAGKVKQPNR